MPAGIECGDELDSLPWFFHTNNSMNLWRTIKLDNSHLCSSGSQVSRLLFLTVNQCQNITLHSTTFQIQKRKKNPEKYEMLVFCHFKKQCFLMWISISSPLRRITWIWVLVEALLLENLEFLLCHWVEGRLYLLWFENACEILIRAFGLNNEISYTRDKLHSSLFVRDPIRITQVWCSSHLEFVPAFRYSSLRLCWKGGSRCPGQSHREPGSWEVAQVHALGKHWKKLDGKETGTRELSSLPQRVTWLHQSRSETRHILSTSKKKCKATTHLKSQWLFFLIPWWGLARFKMESRSRSSWVILMRQNLGEAGVKGWRQMAF